MDYPRKEEIGSNLWHYCPCQKKEADQELKVFTAIRADKKSLSIRGRMKMMYRL
jgi:hypothetical protein